MNKKAVYLILLGLIAFNLGLNAQVNLNSGLVLYLPFNGNANDSSANSNRINIKLTDVIFFKIIFNFTV
jgi:hypothetical protein